MKYKTCMAKAVKRVAKITGVPEYVLYASYRTSRNAPEEIKPAITMVRMIMKTCMHA